MPKILYIIKVILIFWVFKFGAELIGEGLVIALHFACGMHSVWNYILYSSIRNRSRIIACELLQCFALQLESGQT